MNALELVSPAHYFLDIEQDSLRAFDGLKALELPLERQPDGKLTEGCKENLIAELQKLILRKPWQPRPRAFCAITARGVSLRRLVLPAAGKDELNRLLPLQIEREFPLGPDQLAWGTQSVNGANVPADGASPKQELVVAAIKKDILAEYSSIISACGATAVFTLGALARSYLCPQPPGIYTVLSVGRTSSELITIEGGAAVAVRVLGWGLKDFSMERPNLRVYGGAEPLLSPAGSQSPASFGGSGPAAQARPGYGSLEPLVNLINGQSLGRKIFVTGISDWPTSQDFSAILARSLDERVVCEAVEWVAGASGSQAIQGMQRSVSSHSGAPPLVLQLKQSEGKARLAQEAPLKLAGMALGLAVIALLLPLLEAVVLKSHVANKLAGIKADAGRFTTIDRELDFLQYLRENEPPYMDALLVLSRAAPAGTHFDSVSMNRRGELSLRGSLRDGQQVADLRSKLIDSGFFASVGIEEQSPSPDRQKVSVRMSAQWKGANLRKPPTPEPPKAAPDGKSASSVAGPAPAAGADKPATAPKPSGSKPARN